MSEENEISPQPPIARFKEEPVGSDEDGVTNEYFNSELDVNNIDITKVEPGITIDEDEPGPSYLLPNASSDPPSGISATPTTSGSCGQQS